MNTTLYLATHEGLVVAEQQAGNWQIVRQGLNGRSVTSVITREGVILAGTTQGIFCSQDNGRTWAETDHGLTIPHVRWLAFHPDISDFEFAGTEPAAIFTSRDGAKTWHECPEVTTLRQQLGWWLPYSPAAGCVRGFAHHGTRVYAAVEVGGLLRSDDSGETWRLADGSDGQPKFGRPRPGLIHPDVHSVATHPASADWVFAPTGGGFYVSTDGGTHWRCRYENCYVRAVWVNPTNVNHLVLGPSEGPDGRNGRIETSTDGGHTWQPTPTRWSHNMVERFVQVEQTLFAVLANGELMVSALSPMQWQPVLPQVKGVNMVAYSI